MSTTQVANPRRGHRNQNRQPKPTAVPNSDGNSDFIQTVNTSDMPNTPPSQFRANHTFAPATEPPENVGEDGKPKAKRGRPKKQPPPEQLEEHIAQTTTTPPAAYNVSNYRPASSQNMVLSPERMKSTPLKQVYAGPTFHASPAASSLPMPSFLVRNANNVTAPTSAENDSRRKNSNTEDLPPTETTRTATQAKFQEREATPLDFLFNAARAAKAGQGSGSPANQSENDLTHIRAVSSPPTSREESSPANRVRNHSRQPTEGSAEMFPLEMDGSTTPDMRIGPAFATPYSVRMNDLRSGSAPSNANLDPEEQDRKAKSDALKRLLMNPQPQRPASASARLREVSNPFDSPSSTPNGISQRHTSGPSSPAPYNAPMHAAGNYTTPHAAYPFSQQQSFANYANGSPKTRTPSSNLRREVTPIKPAIELPASQYQISTRSTPPVSYPAREKSAEAKSMEDDLRRILKLNLSE